MLVIIGKAIVYGRSDISNLQKNAYVNQHAIVTEILANACN